MFYSENIIIANKLDIGIPNYTELGSYPLVIQKVTDNDIWASNGYDLYKSKDNGTTFEKQFKVPVSLISLEFFGNSKLLRDYFNRYELLEFEILPTGTIIIFSGGKVFRSEGGGKNFEIVHNYNHYGLFGPNKGRGVMPMGIVVDNTGTIFFGEYGFNANRDEVSLYFSKDDGKTWKTLKKFLPGEIRHIHAVQYDEYENLIWIATGDLPNESIIGNFDLKYHKFTVVFQGSRMYTAVSLMFTSDYIYWGTDAPERQNYIYRYNRKTKELQRLNELDGPVYYSYKMNNGNMIFGTYVEKGAGELDRKATVWYSINGNDWQKLIALDIENNIERGAHSRFPRGQKIDKFVLNFLNTKKYDRYLLVLFEKQSINYDNKTVQSYIQ